MGFQDHSVPLDLRRDGSICLDRDDLCGANLHHEPARPTESRVGFRCVRRGACGIRSIGILSGLRVDQAASITSCVQKQRRRGYEPEIRWEPMRVTLFVAALAALLSASVDAAD